MMINEPGFRVTENTFKSL